MAETISSHVINM